MAKMWGVPDGRLAQEMRKYYTEEMTARFLNEEAGCC